MNTKDINLLIEILNHKGRKDLSALLENSASEVQCSDQYGSYLFSILSTFIIYSPVPQYYKLNSLAPDEKKILLDSILEVYPIGERKPEITGFQFMILRDNKILKRDKFILWLKKYIEKHFSASDWDDLAYSTACKEIIFQHTRLLRSFSFGDDDYGSCVSSVIEDILNKNFSNLEIIIRNTGFKDWLKEKHVEAYNELFGETNHILETVKTVSIQSSFELEKYIARISSSTDSDPELAIGSTKEMLESILKTILNHFGEEVGTDDIPQLLKRVQKLLKISPEDSLNKKGEDIIKRILSNLGQIVIGISELRNLYGTGHGRVGKSLITSRHAHLVANCGAAVSRFLMETFEERK